MNKIVCDVCGTSYPETAAQCPICGTAKTDTNKTTAGGEAGYAYVKGGRFSHANVRKRNAGNKELPRVVVPAKPPKAEAAPKKEAVKKEAAPKAETAPKAEPAPKKETAPKSAAQEKPKKSYTNVILALIAFVLVAAIVLVFGMVVMKFVGDRPDPQQTTGSTQSGDPANTQISCTGVRFALSEKTFTSLDGKFQLSVILSPSNTTDTVWYETSDPNVAVVTENGIVTPVGDGTAIIYAHCGEYTAECSITCDVGYVPTTPTDPVDPTEPTQPIDPDVTLTLNSSDFTLDGYGDSWMLYSGELDPAKITWTSSDVTVATVTNGKVVAVGNGNATITAEYNGQKVTCAVHCKNVVVLDCELRTVYGKGDDFTIKVGSTIKLYLIEKESGLKIQPENVTYTLSKEGVVTIDANGKITAIAAGKVYVYVTYGDQTYKATVRVSG